MTQANSLDPTPDLAALPRDGLERYEVEAALEHFAAADREATGNVRFSRRFYPRDDVVAIASYAYGKFAQTGRSSPYPGLPSPRSIETMRTELEEAGLALMRAPCGARAVLTSGGTESVILALKSCLTLARRRGDLPGKPEVVAAWSAHPCIDKAAELLGATLVRVPVGADCRSDARAMADRISPSTVMLYGSFPSYSYGIEDDIAELGRIAGACGLWLHVDACMSGFLAPFLRMNGKAIPDFDFSVPGVASISADLHKHGYSAKGASMLLFRSAELADGHGFTYSDYPLPPMTTPTLAGTAPGAPIASAWAVMRYLGISGYRELADQLDAAREAIATAARAVPGYEVLGRPLFSLLVITSAVHDIPSVQRGLAGTGWFSLPVSRPPGIHINVSVPDVDVADDFRRALLDLG